MKMKKKTLRMIAGAFVQIFMQIVIWGFLSVGCIVCVKKGIDLMID